MNDNPPLFDLAINLACVGLGFFLAYRASWKGKQPSNHLYFAIVLFVTNLSWYLTGTFMHVRMLPIFEHSSTSPERAWRFLVIAAAMLLYAVYLFIAGKAKAR
jgi:hypothetical protein